MEDLQEGDDHDDGEDEDAEGFEASAPDGEFASQSADPPLDELVRRPDD